MEVTFRLKDRAAKRLNAALNARQGQTLGLRFDVRFIAFVVVRGTFDTNEVSTFVEDLDRASLESVLAPLKGKISHR